MRLVACRRWSGAASSQAGGWFGVAPVVEVTVIVLVVVPIIALGTEIHRCPKVCQIIFVLGIPSSYLFGIFLNRCLLRCFRWSFFGAFFNLFRLRVTTKCNDFLFLSFLKEGTTDGGDPRSGLRLLKCPRLPSLELGVSWAAGLKLKHLQLERLVLRVGGLLRPRPSKLRAVEMLKMVVCKLWPFPWPRGKVCCEPSEN
ncbi:hypothetical protein PIB30_090158 [Stylosanthes scabra]|uniref:Transmembrane protein n=1 Tax=Stylosanthes scabra TaxID=79078 RepID=A0ABU6XW08_9FABA|nr:hypothetical protein [Stylosanthes scabra]